MPIAKHIIDLAEGLRWAVAGGVNEFSQADLDGVARIFVEGGLVIERVRQSDGTIHAFVRTAEQQGI